ncbi:type II secretion system F family protein, partial [Mycobacterium tuberculosis]
PQLYRSTVEAGESAGKLDAVLERLADYSERSQALRSKVMLATFYPAILTVVAIGVVTLLMTYVVPKVVGVFDSIGADLPPLTKGLIAISAFLQAYGLYIFLA